MSDNINDWPLGLADVLHNPPTVGYRPEDLARWSDFPLELEMTSGDILPALPGYRYMMKAQRFGKHWSFRLPPEHWHPFPKFGLRVVSPPQAAA